MTDPTTRLIPCTASSARTNVADLTLTDALLAVLMGEETPQSNDDAEALAGALAAAVVECFATSVVRVQGVPMPIDIALALIDRGLLKIVMV